MAEVGARKHAVGACASLLASAGGFAYLALRSWQWPDWRALAFGGGLAIAAFGLTRKNVVLQIFSRAMAWVLFAPTAIVTVAEATHGRFEASTAAFALSSGLALALARPMLSTAHARATFAPHKFRRTFLAACSATVTVGLVVGMVAFEALSFGDKTILGFSLGALGTSMLAAALGVLRMRGWGIALGVLTSIASLVTGIAVGEGVGFALATCAVPGTLLLLPILLSKLGLGESTAPSIASETTHTRVAADLPSRVRVAVDHDDADLASDGPIAPRAARAVLP